jgi:hypothetical protein
VITELVGHTPADFLTLLGRESAARVQIRLRHRYSVPQAPARATLPMEYCFMKRITNRMSMRRRQDSYRSSKRSNVAPTRSWIKDLHPVSGENAGRITKKPPPIDRPQLFLMQAKNGLLVLLLMTILAKSLFTLMSCDLMALSLTAAGHWLEPPVELKVRAVSDFETNRIRTPQIRVSLGHVLCADENG